MAINKGDFAQATEALAGADAPAKKKNPKLRTREMHIRRGTAGGFIVKHHLETEDGEPHHQHHEFPLLNKKQLLDHVTEHMAGGESEAPEVAAESRE
jgi:hypothetical protein